MLVGDFMIDDTNYADCLALYNFNHVDKIKGKESFPISLMTISTISALFIIEVRSETLPMIPSRKLFFVVSSILVMIFLSDLIAVTNLSFLTMSLQALYFLWYQRG